MLYARLASGYRVGGGNAVYSPRDPLYDPVEPAQFRPDETDNYEIGFKGGSPGRSLSFDVSLYCIDWRHIQVSLEDPVNQTNYTTNGSRARSQGMELSLEARPLAVLDVGASIAYGEAALTAPFPANSAAFGTRGDRLPYSSRLSGNVSAEVRVPFADGLIGLLGVAVSYVGSRPGTFTTSANRTLYPAYTRTDLNAGIEQGDWTAHVFVSNATDARGILGGGLGTFPPFAFTYIQPRTVGLSVARMF
jgi:outer membrane receptor for Fe3+-dicitrate